MRQLFTRFTAPTPAFWRNVQKAAAAGLALVVALQAGTSGPAQLTAALPVCFTVFTTVLAVAQFTCSDSPADQPAAVAQPIADQPSTVV